MENDTAEPTRRWRLPRSFRVPEWVLVALAAGVVAIAALPMTSSTSATVGPGTVTAHVAPARDGETVLAIPPLGRLSAPTHSMFTSVQLRLDEVNVRAVQDLSKAGGVQADALSNAVQADLPSLFRSMAIRLVGLSAALGVVVALLLPGRQSNRTWVLKRIGLGALSASLVASAYASLTIVGYKPERFDSPQISGPLALVSPLLTDVGDQIEDGLRQIDERSKVLSDKLAELYSSSINADVVGSSGETVILHVSDIHLNPVGISLARELATTFDVDAVLDTGDLTSFGQEPEAAMVTELSRFDVPYYFVAGNHDGAGARKGVAALDGVTAINGKMVEVGDVKIVGVDDPTETAFKTIPKSELAEQYEAQYAETEALIEEYEPDLLAVHNPVQAVPAVGKVATVAAGHLHRFDLSESDGTVIAVVASSGATGLGALLVETTEDYSFQLLRYNGSTLVAVDTIALRGTRGEFVSQRHLINDSVTLDDADDILEEIVLEPSAEETTILEDPESEPSDVDQPDVDGDDGSPDGQPTTTVEGVVWLWAIRRRRELLDAA